MRLPLRARWRNVINLLDPDVIVLGGGVSGVERLYRTVPTLWGQWVFSDRVDTKLGRRTGTPAACGARVSLSRNPAPTQLLNT